MNFVLSIDEMKELEHHFISIQLMEQAGLGLYEKIKSRFPNKKTKFLIVAGIGGNGGDAFVLARYLYEANYDVQVYLPNNHLVLNETKINQERYQGTIIKQINDEYDVIVDGYYGIGCNRNLNENDVHLIEQLNQMKGYKIAIDIPSGINGNNGLIMNKAFKSDRCYVIQFYKYGHFLNDGSDYYKEIELLDIGLKIDQKNYVQIPNIDFSSLFLARKNNTNKGDYGRCVFISGCKETPGAALLCSQAYSALKIGVGYATICIPESLYPIYALHHPENIYYLLNDCNGHSVYNEEKLQKLLEYDVITIGMGLSNTLDTYKIVEYFLKNYQNTLILDADALNAIANEDLSVLNHAKCNIVLTPHIKEFSRLMKQSVEMIQSNPIFYAKEFVKQYNVTLILKSNATIIANQNHIYLNITGTPALAKAGSGDVLSGILTGVCALAKSSTIDCAIVATYLLGQAGIFAMQKQNDYSVVATDVIQEIPNVIHLIQQKGGKFHV